MKTTKDQPAAPPPPRVSLEVGGEHDGLNRQFVSIFRLARLDVTTETIRAWEASAAAEATRFFDAAREAFAGREDVRAWRQRVADADDVRARLDALDAKLAELQARLTSAVEAREDPAPVEAALLDARREREALALRLPAVERLAAAAKAALDAAWGTARNEVVRRSLDTLAAQRRGIRGGDALVNLALLAERDGHLERLEKLLRRHEFVSGVKPAP